MSDAQGMERFFRERGFGQLIGWGDSPALLVIDFTRAFTDPALPLGANLDRELAETVRVLGSAREAAIPIYYSSVCYEDKDLRDAGLWAKKIAGTMTLRAGTPEVEIDPRLGRRADEAIIVKKYGSVFFGTDLLTRLNTQRVDTLILTGCTTSGCVRATAVDAVQNGFRPMVVREAVGDRSQPAHDQSLFDLHSRYADVVSVDETLEYLSHLKAKR
jgi:maleamate amidohydrolase